MLHLSAFQFQMYFPSNWNFRMVADVRGCLHSIPCLLGLCLGEERLILRPESSLWPCWVRVICAIQQRGWFENTILKISFVVRLLFPISDKNWKTRIASLFSWDLYPHLCDVSFELENATCHGFIVYNESELPACCADNFMWGGGEGRRRK